MELREFAERVLLLPDLDAKLQKPADPLIDNVPGKPIRVNEPARPPNLQFAERRTAPNMPHVNTFGDIRKRGIAHHIMANHELQALEVMAWTLLAFPEAPTEFRKGLAAVALDEQRHTRMHVERAASLGVPFGSLPVNCYIWKKAMVFSCVLDYLAGLPLTFEGCNLDHSLEFEAAFQKVGDAKSAAMMRRIHEDEIEHVAFGYKWLNQLKPADASAWETYTGHLAWPLRAEKSVGNVFQKSAREAAGIDADFVSQLEAICPTNAFD